MCESSYIESQLRESLSFDDLPSYPPSFTLFPDLPPELRNAVWRLTFPRPRHIRRDGDNRAHPIALYITRESRQLALFHFDWYDPAIKGLLRRPGYIDYSADFVHQKALFPYAMRRIENLMHDLSDSHDLGTLILDRVQRSVAVLERLKEVLIVVHYREQGYGPFKPTEAQLQKKLKAVNPRIVDELRNTKAQKEEEWQIVQWRIPNIVMEPCKPCFRRRGGRFRTDSWCKECQRA